MNTALSQKLLQKLPDITPRAGYFDSSSSTILNPLFIEDHILLFYFTNAPISLGAVLIDKHNPSKILARSKNAIWLTPEPIKPTHVEKNGSAIIFYFKLYEKTHYISFDLTNILAQLKFGPPNILDRAAQNPILRPNSLHKWESHYVFNPAALYLQGKFHLVYRAMGHANVSTLGYASSKNGIDFDERLPEPIHQLTGDANSPTPTGSVSSCEDPRLVCIDDTIYLTYTAFSGWEHAQRMALTSISVDDFLKKNWNWKKVVLISSPLQNNKNWVIFPEKIKGKYAILHSISPEVKIDYFNHLDFHASLEVKSEYKKTDRSEYWDNWIRGVGPPPLKTKDGWLIIHHAMDKQDPDRYKLGAKILDINDPTKILYSAPVPLLEPDAPYENEGFKAGVVYACGAVIKEDVLYVYYGGADTVVCVATAKLNEILDQIKSDPNYNAKMKTSVLDITL